MDTTPEYKKQCKAAFGDIGFIFSSNLPNLLIVDNDELLVSWAGSVERITDFHRGLFKIHGQLFRQDQLQGLLINRSDNQFEWEEDVWIIAAFYRFAINQWKKFDSFEQLWLAFVMHERFQK